ncbi:MAG: PH domain-containing protein [Spirochaetales bacterium]|jgi:hypothetical protein|nr:PH domain-containing protein [Spirochaetales bacterium]
MTAKTLMSIKRTEETEEKNMSREMIDEFKTYLQTVIDDNGTEIFGTRMLINNAPSEKLSIIACAVKLPEDEKIIIFFDDTIKGTGKCGLLFTSWGIRYKDNATITNWALSWDELVEKYTIAVEGLIVKTLKLRKSHGGIFTTEKTINLTQAAFDLKWLQKIIASGCRIFTGKEVCFADTSFMDQGIPRRTHDVKSADGSTNPTLNEIKEMINDSGQQDILSELGDSIKQLPEILAEDEKIFFLTSGFSNETNAIILCTNKRVIIYRKTTFLGFTVDSGQIDTPLEKINSIQHLIGIFDGEISIWDGASKTQITAIDKKMVVPFVNAVNKAIADIKNKTSSNEKPAGDDVFTQIEKLDVLHQKGILTEEEFQAKKKCYWDCNIKICGLERKLKQINRKTIIFFHEIFCTAMFFMAFVQMSVYAQTAPAWIQNLEQVYPSREWIAVIASGSSQEGGEAAVMNALARAFKTDVESLTQASQHFSQMVNESTGKKSISFDESEYFFREVSTATKVKGLIGVQIEQYHAGDGTVYVNARMNRRECAARYTSMIQENDRIIHSLIAVAENLPNTLDSYAALNYAYNLAIVTDNFQSILEVLNPQSVSHKPSYNSADAIKLLLQAAARTIIFKIEVEGDVGGQAGRAFGQCFSNRGFRTTRGTNYTYLLNASLYLSNAEMGPNQRYRYVRYNLTVYIENQDGMEVYSSTENGREGHASESEARLWSLRKIESSIKENEFAHGFNDYLASLLK